MQSEGCKEVFMSIGAISGGFQIHSSMMSKDVPSVITKDVEGSNDEQWVMYRITNRQLEKIGRYAEEKAIDYFADSLDDLFKTDAKAMLSGKTQEQYASFRSSLDEAIDNNDYKRAERLIDQYFGDDHTQLSDSVNELMKRADDVFWNSLKESTKDFVLEDEAYKIMDGMASDAMFSKELGDTERRVRSEMPDANKEDGWDERIASMHSRGVEHSKDQLWNANRNAYSEDAESVLNSAGEFIHEEIAGPGLTKEEEKKDYRDLMDDEKLALNVQSKASGFAARYERMFSKYGEALQSELAGRGVFVLKREKKPEEASLSIEDADKELNNAAATGAQIMSLEGFSLPPKPGLIGMYGEQNQFLQQMGQGMLDTLTQAGDGDASSFDGFKVWSGFNFRGIV